VLYLVATILVAMAAANVTVLWPGLPGRLERVLLWIAMVPGLITLVALLLGFAGLLTPTAMLLAHGAIAIASGVVAWRRGNLALRLPSPKQEAGRALRSPWLWPLLLGGAAVIAWQVYVGLRIPPFGWDALSYHLPPAVWWLQAERIYSVPTQFTFGYAYPQGWSLLLLWQLAFTATDHLVNVTALPFVLFGTLAAYGLAREMGIGKRWAPWAGAFWALTPLVLEQLTVPYNDVAVGALTLGVFYFILRFWRSGGRSTGPLWVVGLLVGLILGTKPNGFLVLAFACVLMLFPRVQNWRSYISAVVGRGLCAGIPALALAGFWYIRNLVLYHNPLFPAKVSLLGHVIFPGPRTIKNLINMTPTQTKLQNLGLSLNEHLLRYTFDSPTGGLGPVFTCLGGAALVAMVVHAVTTRRWRLLAVTLAGGAIFLLQPFWYLRYSLFLPALAGVAFAYVLQRLARRRWRPWLQAAAVALLLYPLALVPFQPQTSAETLWQVDTAIAEGRRLSSAEFGLARDYAFVDSMPNLDHPANRIAYTEGRFVYPLFGRNRDRVVYYVPATTYDGWVSALLKERTTFLIIGADDAIEAAWAKSNPDRFVPWGRSWPYAVYLIRSDEPRNQELLRQGARP